VWKDHPVHKIPPEVQDKMRAKGINPFLKVEMDEALKGQGVFWGKLGMTMGGGWIKRLMDIATGYNLRPLILNGGGSVHSCLTMIYGFRHSKTLLDTPIGLVWKDSLLMFKRWQLCFPVAPGGRNPQVGWNTVDVQISEYIWVIT
jgi:hypothetical protein